MSKKFREKFNDENVTRKEIREFTAHAGKTDENGKPVYYTEQQYKEVCDVNRIIQKYDKTGLITHVSRIEAKYGDNTGMDYKEALDKVIEIDRMFSELPSKIRKRFSNSPEEYLAFMENPGNRKEAIELGLIRHQWTPETDGLGEHIKNESERELNIDPKKDEPKKDKK